MVRKILLGLLTLVVAIVACCYLYIQYLKPTYDGEVKLDGLTQVTHVHFDDYGIPHIYAVNEEDAYRALGYVHAQDRLFQMEVVRRIAAGRLSEIFGKDMVDADKFFRTLGIHKYSEAILEDFNRSKNDKFKNVVIAYLSGVNSFIENGATPVEFTILGIDKTPFSLIDINNALGYMGFSFAAAQKIEPILTKIYKDLGPEYLAAIDIGSSQSTLSIKNFQDVNPQTELSDYVSDVLNKLPAPVWYGSNSWVLGPEKTESGKVILENDPHVAFAQPAVWYEAHIETPDFTFYGYHIAGVPFAAFGHTREFATGLTMFTNDDIDFFQEKNSNHDSSFYVYKDQLKPYDSRKELIKVKESTDVEITVRESIHGPIINDVLNLKGDPISLFWTYTKTKVQVAELLYTLGHSKGIEDVQSVAEQIHAPGLNIMYGDTEGNIAWWASAKMIQRPDSANGALINEGSSGKFDPKGYYDFEENPRSINPPWNYVYSANNQTKTMSGIPYPGHYAAEDRAKRITTLIESQDKFNIEDMKKMAVDDQSENSAEVVQSIVEVLDDVEVTSKESTAISILQKWNNSNSVDLVAPTIYNKFLFKILQLAMEDELGEKDFNKLFLTHTIQRTTQPFLANDTTIWWDDISTPETETRQAIFTRAIREGLDELEDQLGEDMSRWAWGKVHTLEHNHPFGSIEALRGIFNVGPFSVSGGNKVINNLRFTLNGEGEYNVIVGPSTRRLVDFSNVENNSWGILPTGNSGNPFSKHYRDQAEMYVKGEFRKQLLNKEEITSTSPDLLILKPR